MKINIKDQTYEPSVNELGSVINDIDSKKRWLELIDYITKISKVKTEKGYSKETWRPGWNLKYKKSGKALCTMYPEDDQFTVLVVLGADNIETFENSKTKYTNYVVETFEKATLFNKTKWLMIDVTSEKILNDVKELIALKLN